MDQLMLRKSGYWMLLVAVLQNQWSTMVIDVGYLWLRGIKQPMNDHSYVQLSDDSYGWQVL